MVEYEAEYRSAESGKCDPSITSQNGGKNRRLDCNSDHIFLNILFQKQKHNQAICNRLSILDTKSCSWKS
jgi:hypothetical protein